VACLFVPDGDLLHPTELTRGPWRADAQHGGPPSALLGRASEAEAARGDGRIARIAVELVRPVPLVPLRPRATTEVVSRRVSQVVAELVADELVVARSRAVVLHVEPVGEIDEPAASDLPGPEAEVRAPSWASGDGATVYHRDAVEHRFVAGSFLNPGPATDWIRLRVPLVAGEETSGLCRVLAAADFGSGISAVFGAASTVGLINADLVVALHREPVGEWVRIDAETRLGPEGIGLCTTTLSDQRGLIGTATQSLMPLRVGGDR
jgi:hypothetical protein